MPRDVSARRVIEKRTRYVLPADLGDPFGLKVRQALMTFGQLTIQGYLNAFWTKVDDPEATLHVFKKLGSAGFSKKGELAQGVIDPSDAESHIVSHWGPGTYQLRPEYKGRYYGPASILYKIGVDEEEDKGPKVEDIDEMIAKETKRLGGLATLKQFKDIAGGGEEEMKAEQLAQLMTAMKPDLTILTAMMESANRRADAAEVRAHELTIKMLDQRGGVQQGLTPVIADILKAMKPEVVSALLAPPEPGTNWLDTIRDVVREFGPALQTIVVKYLNQSGLALPVARAPVAAAGHAEPQPTPEGGPPMPMPLNPEQQEAKTMLLDYVQEKDYLNAYAVLENFPGFMPTPNGPLPIGDFILSRIDPAVKARVYVPLLMQFAPELKDMLAQVEGFVVWIQQRIMAEDERARAEHGARPEAEGR